MKNIEIVKKIKKKHSDRIRFGNNRDLVIDRDNNECQICGKKEKLVVHHIDGTENRIKMNANNEIENLLTLCSSCHRKLHHSIKKAGR